jgi:hypothetical protein
MELGCELLVEYHTDLFQVEASLLFDGADAHVIAHIPMAPKEGQLRLFRLHPFPLPLFDDRYLIPDVKNDVLAISSTSSRLNVQLAAVDLLSCHRINQLFMCDNFGVLSREFNNSCIACLYMSMFTEAQKVCKFKVVPATEQAYQIRKGEFIVYLPEASTINIKCRNGTEGEIHLNRGSQKVHISKGCQGELKKHRLISDYSDTLNTDIKTFEWNWDPVDFMEGTGDDILKAINKLEQVKVINPDLSEIRYIASVPDSSNDPAYDYFGYILSLVCTVAIVIGICVCGIALYNKCGCCCRQTPAVHRRREQHVRRKRSASCGILCCCRRKDTIDDAVHWHRGAGSDTDDITFTPAAARRPRAPRKPDNPDQIQRATLSLEKRLSTLEKQYRLSKNYE